MDNKFHLPFPFSSMSVAGKNNSKNMQSKGLRDANKKEKCGSVTRSIVRLRCLKWNQFRFSSGKAAVNLLTWIGNIKLVFTRTVQIHSNGKILCLEKGRNTIRACTMFVVCTRLFGGFTSWMERIVYFELEDEVAKHFGNPFLSPKKLGSIAWIYKTCD